MAKITQEKISSKIRELLNPEPEKSQLLNLLDLISRQNRPMVNTSEQPVEQGGTASPTMPNIVGKQQLMESNAIAQKYPYLGAR